MILKQPGIGLIEIIIAIALIGVMAMIVAPQFSRRIPEKEKILNTINSLLRIAQNNAVLTGKVHRIFFDLKSSTIIIQQEHAENFTPISISYSPSKATWNPLYQIAQFIVLGKDEIAHGAGVTTSQVWFFIMPDGTAQIVTLVFRNEETGELITLLLNPFTAQMRLV